MSRGSMLSTIATIGIDIGKNRFHRLTHLACSFGGMVGGSWSSDGSTRLHGLLAISVLRSSSFLHASSVSSQS
jgi:hypothetical protein